MDWHPNRVASAYPLLLNCFWLEIKVGAVLSGHSEPTTTTTCASSAVAWKQAILTIFRSYK